MDIPGCHGGSASFEQWGNCCRKVWCTTSTSCTLTDILSATMPGQKVLISANLILTSRRHTWLVSQSILKRSTVSIVQVLASYYLIAIDCLFCSWGHTSWAHSDSAPWYRFRWSGWCQWSVPWTRQHRPRWKVPVYGHWSGAQEAVIKAARKAKVPSYGHWSGAQKEAVIKAARKAKVTQQDHHWRYVFSIFCLMVSCWILD